MKYRFQFIFVVAMMLLAIGAHAQTNSTFQAPYVGATHTYSVDGGATGNTNTFTWYITDKNGTKLNSGTNNVFTFGGTTTSSDGQNIIGASVTSLPITWNSSAAGNTYYLCVEEKGGECTNKRVIEVNPVANAFDILIADATGLSSTDLKNRTDLVTSPVSSNTCATLLTTPDNIQTHNGTTTLQFKIWKTGSMNAWTFDYAIVQSAGDATYEATLTDPDGKSLSTSITGQAGISVAKDYNYCILTLMVTNKVDKQTFNVTVSNGKDAFYNITTSTTTNKTATHTIDAMPNTTPISGN